MTTTTKRRDRDSGSIEKRGKNWRLRYWVLDANGKRKQKSETVRGNKTYANQVLSDRLTEIRNGGLVNTSDQTVAQFLGHWMQAYAATNTTLRTQQGYRHYIRSRIVPTIGSVRLQDLQGPRIQGMYADMVAEGLSNRTVLHCHRILKGALNYAVKSKMLTHNPADSATPPRPERKSMETWDANTFRSFLDAAKGSPLLNVYRLAALTGMRRSELCGLKWDVVDLDEGYLRVTRTLQQIYGQGLVEGKPKTDRSRRTISLGDGALEVLRGVRAAQAKQRLSIGPLWRDTGYVFTDELGSPIRPDRLTKEFGQIVKAERLPHLSFHGLRHTAASLMIAGDVHARTIADILGHSTITVTMDTYGHMMKGVQQDAINVLDEQLSRS